MGGDEVFELERAERAAVVSQDRLGRDFTAKAPELQWVGDITYIPTREGWAFLATVLDCYTRKVVEYAMANHMRSELICQALIMATCSCSYTPGVTIFHSERGRKYLSTMFTKLAVDLHIKRSAGRTGTYYDNFWAESFNATLKNESCH